jgi:RNA polymerase sigma factor (sigma-70 family)
MSTAPLGKVVRHMYRLLGSSRSGDLTDAGLLDRFVKVRDQAAFALLTQRHGSRVLATCLRVLGNRHDAEDAFQATFFVLACKARSIARREALGGWLHGVAHRIALQLGNRAGRRRECLQEVDDLPSQPPRCPMEEQELRAYLDAELAQLPHRYRSAIVLHHLEGRSIEEAADQLGWSVGQFRGALFRGRRLLESRFRRRGLVLSAGLFVTAVSARAVPASLLDSTVACSLLFATNQSAPIGSIPAAATALAQGALQAMFVTKLKIAVALAVMIGAIGLSVGIIGVRGLKANASGGAELPADSENSAATPKRSHPDERSDRQRIQGAWIAKDEPSKLVKEFIEEFSFDENEAKIYLFTRTEDSHEQKVLRCAVKLYTREQTKWMDLYPEGRGKVSFAYEIRDDELILIQNIAGAGTHWVYDGPPIYKRKAPKNDVNSFGVQQTKSDDGSVYIKLAHKDYRRLFGIALAVLAEYFEEIRYANQYAGRIDAQSIPGETKAAVRRQARVIISPIDEGGFSITVEIYKYTPGASGRDAGLQQVILQRLKNVVERPLEGNQAP